MAGASAWAFAFRSSHLEREEEEEEARSCVFFGDGVVEVERGRGRACLREGENGFPDALRNVGGEAWFLWDWDAAGLASPFQGVL